MIILARPIYLPAPSFEEWVHRNSDELVQYWLDCDAALVKAGEKPVASLNEFPAFCQTQWDLYRQEVYNDEEPGVYLDDSELHGEHEPRMDPQTGFED